MELPELSLAAPTQFGHDVFSSPKSDQSRKRKHHNLKNQLQLKSEPLAIQKSVVDLDLQVKDPLPLDWEQCLDLESGKMYYLNRKTQRKSWNLPKVDDDDHHIHHHQKLDLELNISTLSFDHQQHHFSSSHVKLEEEEEEEEEGDSNKSNNNNNNNKSQSCSSYSKNNNNSSSSNMVALACFNCHLLVILSKSSPACPNCKFLHSSISNHHHHHHHHHQNWPSHPPKISNNTSLLKSAINNNTTLSLLN